MTFTFMGDPLPTQLLRGQYRVVLSKIESGQLSVGTKTVLQTVMKTRHVFRGGTSIDSDKDAERKIYYTDLIDECMNEREDTAAIGNSTSTVRIDLVGRRVIMSADVFGGSRHECYHGVVIRKGRYKQHGKSINGYQVRWHDGDADYW